MSVVVIGLNHRTVPLDVLERMTVADDRMTKALHDLVARPNLSEAVLLSTCNRTEVYAVAERFHGAFDDICRFLSDVSGLDEDTFVPHLYSHYDDMAVDHLFSVAAGLDSAVLGESEILGQVRGAWERAQREAACRSTLNLLFRQAVEVGKRSRTETAIGRHTASVSHAALEMAAEHLGGLSGRKVLVLGAGEMGEGMALGLLAAGVADIAVANRTFDRAVELAARVGGHAVGMIDVAPALADVDLLLTGTGASSILLEHGEIAQAMAARPERPMVIVDVAVPRDVDPSVADLAGVTLLDLDDLRAFAARGIAERLGEVGAVREIVELEVRRYVDLASARTVAPLVASLRERAEAMRTAELERHRAKLGDLDERQREAIEGLTRGLVAKLLHDPTVRLKDAAGSPRGERLAEALRDLFDL